MNNLIEFENVTINRKNKNILKNISFNIPKGSTYCLIGENGAGKTTLMKAILGLCPVKSGKIIFNNQEIKQDDLSEISALIENPPIYKNLSIYDNLKVISLLRNANLKQINHILEVVGLDNVSPKTKAKSLSLGMKQRLGIGMALVPNPSFLILDEPTNGLDISGVKEFNELINQLKNQGITILITSHHLHELESIADYVGILNNSQLAYSEKFIQGTQNIEDIYWNIVNTKSIGANNE
ncbi:ABC-2 type transport system ATP-binding protein [Weissella uvarum]|uniref:ABC transporter ATP-binding protein n=1 Tax=Weissella uvarum TaxID=1479233 RepID=UPI00195F964E|nr:ATP-binding cassette domain-containing protein [Weissella uvarum]MBM7617390.1 ABC-2 type transport system ATP-binding protein [Weissella uvarum]MCM0595725.1 ATP-binding cassette domain-containing protein [Weissella uvarum]